MLKGKEWWKGFRSKMDTTSIRDGLASRSPVCRVRSTARWQYVAYWPVSLLKTEGNTSNSFLLAPWVRTQTEPG